MNNLVDLRKILVCETIGGRLTHRRFRKAHSFHHANHVEWVLCAMKTFGLKELLSYIKQYHLKLCGYISGSLI